MTESEEKARPEHARKSGCAAYISASYRACDYSTPARAARRFELEIDVEAAPTFEAIREALEGLARDLAHRETPPRDGMHARIHDKHGHAVGYWVVTSGER